MVRIVATSFEELGTGTYTLTNREIKELPKKVIPPPPGKGKEVIHPGDPANVGDGLTLKGELNAGIFLLVFIDSRKR